MLSRRQFLTRSGAVGAAVLFTPQDALGARPLLRGGKFSSGVMSGDPTPRGITLWTRVGDVGGRGGVRLEVARDKDFRNVVMRRTIQTRGSLDHTVKARLGGLRPHERYYYRFETATRNSPVGRFQTALPEDSNEPVRLGFFSCQNYPHGFYNAHELMAREDLDFVVNLGDYIYAEAYHSRADGTGVRDDRIGRQREDVIREAISLDDYRDKYKLYRKDPALRKMHARFPMVSTWDDHEAQDNYAGGAPGGGLPPEQRFSEARRRARLQGVLRAHAALRGAARARPPLPHAALRAQRRPDHARRAPVPRRPAVRRRGRRAVPRVQQPAHAARPGPEGVLQDRARAVAGELEADRQRGGDHAGQDRRRTRTSPTTSGTATPASGARSSSTSRRRASRTSSSSPATSTRSRPATCRSPRAASRWRRRSSAAR